MVQLGQRFDLSCDSSFGKSLLASLRWCYSYDAGLVWSSKVSRGPVLFPVSKDLEVVTVLEAEQAFANCPQGVFGALLEHGDMRGALNLRARMNQRTLQTRNLFPRYNPAHDAQWAAFSWVDALRPKLYP